MGKKVLAYDKKQGCDLLDRQTQLRASQEVEDARPELLVVCPPCAHEKGWENLNQLYLQDPNRASSTDSRQQETPEVLCRSDSQSVA